MTLTKTDIVESIYNQCGLSRTKSDKVVETILETMKATLESGEDVMLTALWEVLCQKQEGPAGKKPCDGQRPYAGAQEGGSFPLLACAQQEAEPERVRCDLGHPSPAIE